MNDGSELVEKYKTNSVKTYKRYLKEKALVDKMLAVLVWIVANDLLVDERVLNMVRGTLLEIENE